MPGKAGGMAKEGQLLREPAQRRSGLVPELWEDTTPPKLSRREGPWQQVWGMGNVMGRWGTGGPECGKLLTNSSMSSARLEVRGPSELGAG